MRALMSKLLIVVYFMHGLCEPQICSMTVVPEGTIVRTVTRLDDLIMEVRNVARLVGDREYIISVFSHLTRLSYPHTHLLYC